MTATTEPMRSRAHSSPSCPIPPRLSVDHNARSTRVSSSSPPVPVLVPAPSSSHIIREESPSLRKEKPLMTFPTPSQSRNLFRLKRPSSSNSALRPTYERDTSAAHFPTHGQGASLVPPRPPRNPARASQPRRPQSSSGVTSSKQPQISKHAPLSQSRLMRSFLHAEPLPLPIEHNIVAQRRSSRRRATQSPSQPSITEDPPANGPRFSTADRTILQELKQKIKAKDAQFRTRNGKKHHPYTTAEVPYPTSYERQVLDNDIWETKSFQEACGSVTWHLFEEPPPRVLDLGCGVGTWILDCARIWKDTTFVGLDVVPLHPDLQQVGSSQLASRITWVQANFLEPLPFQNEEFDYVHIKRIARGVPEDKWDAIFEEISRILKPGGAFEIVEEDLYFPGNLRDHSSDHLPSQATPIVPSDRPHAPIPLTSFYTQGKNNSGSSASSAPWGGSQRPIMSAGFHTEPLLPLLPRSPTEYTETTVIIGRHDVGGRSLELLSPSDASYAPINPRNHSVLEYIYNEMHAARFINLEPLSLLGNTMTLYFKDIRTHPPVIASFPPPPLHDVHSERSGVSSSNSNRSSHEKPRSHLSNDNQLSVPQERLSSDSHEHLSVTVEDLRSGVSQFLTLDNNRYDAFSPSPHAPFPAHLLKRPAVSPRPSIQGRSSRSPDNSSGLLGGNEEPRSSPKTSDKRNLSRLPNPKFEFDVGLLNLHLHLRVEEILACAEAMWDFVLDYQLMHSRRPASRPANRPFVHPRMPKTPAPPPMHRTLLAMSRRDFDDTLARFQFDMRDNMHLGAALGDRLGWTSNLPASRTDSQLEFDYLCNQWARFQLERAAYHRSSSSPLNGSTPVLSSAGTSEEDFYSSVSHMDDTESVGSQPHTHPPSEKEKLLNGTVATSNCAARSSPSHVESKTGREYNDGLSLSHVPPSERQCRTFRVMVAWKA